MSTHTPGPWFVQDGFLTIYSMSEGDSGMTCSIAKVLRDQAGIEKAKNNALVIATAPLLLEVLEASVIDLEYAVALAGRVNETRAEAISGRLVKIRAAISQATGATP